jgi:hypothetical protein
MRLQEEESGNGSIDSILSYRRDKGLGLLGEEAKPWKK